MNDYTYSYKHELSTTLNLIIKIRDIDDNEPIFSELDRRLAKNVSEYLGVNSVVAVLPIARDLDTLPENTQIRYLILPTDDDLYTKFTLNETTGELLLREELELSQKASYEMKIKATSRRANNQVDLKVDDNDKSQLTLQLIVVKDRLTVEFEQQNYYVSVKVNEEKKEFTHAHKMSDLHSRSQRSVLLDESMLPPHAESAVFFAKAHLIKRKLKRSLKFNIEMVKLIKLNQNAIMKLPNSVSNK